MLGYDSSALQLLKFLDWIQRVSTWRTSSEGPLPSHIVSFVIRVQHQCTQGNFSVDYGLEAITGIYDRLKKLTDRIEIKS